MNIPTALEIMNAVAEAYGYTIDDLRRRCRTERLATARAVACYLLMHDLRMSTTEAGLMMERDHGTALYSYRKVENFYLWPKMYATDIAIIKEIEEKYFSDETMDTVGG